MPYYVYIMATQNNKVIYTGVTNNIARRVFEHKNHVLKGFTARYNVNKLVYVEQFNDIEYAISAEKKIKGMVRAKKNALIESVNPNWKEIVLE